MARYIQFISSLKRAQTFSSAQLVFHALLVIKMRFKLCDSDWRRNLPWCRARWTNNQYYQRILIHHHDVTLTLKCHSMTVMVHGMLDLHKIRHRKACGMERFWLAGYTANESPWTGSYVSFSMTYNKISETKLPSHRTEGLVASQEACTARACSITPRRIECPFVTRPCATFNATFWRWITRIGQRQDSCVVLICKAAEIFVSTTIN
jgi:hypothetical protein